MDENTKRVADLAYGAALDILCQLEPNEEKLAAQEVIDQLRAWIGEQP